MIYEMRVYRCLPNRLPALLNRFANVTLKLWEKHGIKQAGFFTTLIGESNHELTYFLAWESLADREKKWNGFMSDPGLDYRARRKREGRPDLAKHQQSVPAADCVFRGQVKSLAARSRSSARRSLNGLNSSATPPPRLSPRSACRYGRN